MSVAVGALAGCVEAPPDQALPDNGLASLACVGDAPACLSGCKDGEIESVAACDGGVWRCEAGIREDLCCAR